MSILESLTEEQVRLVLPRARAWARQAFFATIPTSDPSLSDDPHSEDRDLSHITMRPRGWWRERFEEAGWRQDFIHRRFESECQKQPLPLRMGWTVYVFSPGANQ